MGEEFGVGVCGGGNWYNWNSSINLFASSPCSSAINDSAGSFGIWPTHHHHDPSLFINTTTTTTTNTRSSSDDDSAGSASNGNSNSSSTTLANGNNIIMPSSMHDWSTNINQDHLLHDNGRSEEIYSHLLQQTGLNSSTQINSTTFSEDSSIMNSFKQVNDQAGLSNGFSLNSDSYSLYTSSLLQTLFDTDISNDQSHQEMTNYSSDMFNSLNDFFPTKANSPMMINPSSSSFAKQHRDEFNNRVFVSSTQSQSQFLPSSINTTKPNRPNFTTKHQSEEVGDKDSVAKKTGSEPAFKRPRIETPSPLPTFKVRKEKLGDRITALQQLVSPFGKTDTASVLQEAIEYIKFLHDQASALSTPYFKNGPPPPLIKRQQATSDKIKEQEGLKKDLKSRGLCLVPISSTLPVASETTSDFWTPTFGGTFN